MAQFALPRGQREPPSAEGTDCGWQCRDSRTRTVCSSMVWHLSVLASLWRQEPGPPYPWTVWLHNTGYWDIQAIERCSWTSISKDDEYRTEWGSRLSWFGQDIPISGWTLQHSGLLHGIHPSMSQGTKKTSIRVEFINQHAWNTINTKQIWRADGMPLHKVEAAK